MQKRINNKIYQLITEKSKDLICVLDKNGFFEYANPAFNHILGINPKSLIGTNFFSLLHPNDRDYIIKLFEESYIKKETQPAEVRVKSKHNKWFTFESVGTWVADEKNNLSRIIIVSRELTERQKWEEEIVKAKEKAEEAAEFKSWFLSAMSHEIRTPINVIMGYNNLIKENCSSCVDNQIENYFTNVNKAGRRLLNIITQILDIAKIETGEFPLLLEKINLNYTVKSNLELLKVIAEEKKLNLSFHPSKKTVFVNVDEYCLNGIITNLVSNSIKYSEKGEIQVSISSDANYGKIIVEDEGIGMSEEYLKHIFELFKREDESLKMRYEASGLGLALTKKLIDLLSGSIEVESIKNVGTKITVNLPLVKSVVHSIS